MATEPLTWMRPLPGSTPLTHLSIPGTHNSAAHHPALPSVRCHSHPILTQLQHGIRFLDVRVQVRAPSDPTLVLVHGLFPISLTGPKPFSALLAVLSSFLTSHPSETLILSLKREGTGACTDAHLADILAEHYTMPHPELWYTKPVLPTLGAVRGRIVLLRRFALSPELAASGFGLDAQRWAHNTAVDEHGAVSVQDYFDMQGAADVDVKIGHVREHLRRAVRRRGADERTQGGEGREERLYLNFLSASNFWKVECWPERVAARMNPAVTALLEGGELDGEGEGGIGVVIGDWCGQKGDWELATRIISMNNKLLSQ